MILLSTHGCLVPLQTAHTLPLNPQKKFQKESSLFKVFCLLHHLCVLLGHPKVSQVSVVAYVWAIKLSPVLHT